jgi:hypothetical protein
MIGMFFAASLLNVYIKGLNLDKKKKRAKYNPLMHIRDVNNKLNFIIIFYISVSLKKY